MNRNCPAADKAVQAVSLIEEVTLNILLGEREHGSRAGCVSTQVVAARSGLEHWLGIPVGEAVVERVLLNLLEAGEVERCPNALPPERWRIRESEAVVRSRSTCRIPGP